MVHIVIYIYIYVSMYVYIAVNSVYWGIPKWIIYVYQKKKKWIIYVVIFQVAVDFDCWGGEIPIEFISKWQFMISAVVVHLKWFLIGERKSRLIDVIVDFILLK